MIGRLACAIGAKALFPFGGPPWHPFYAWARDQTGFVPQWNFNKVLLDPQGRIAGTWGSFVKPGGRQIMGAATPYLS